MTARRNHGPYVIYQVRMSTRRPEPLVGGWAYYDTAHRRFARLPRFGDRAYLLVDRHGWVVDSFVPEPALAVA